MGVSAIVFDRELRCGLWNRKVVLVLGLVILVKKFAINQRKVKIDYRLGLA